jgi:hypothetical protein
MYVFPTTGDAVCIVIIDKTDMETCIPQFRQEHGNVEYAIYSGENTPVTVTGLAANGVQSVDVVAGGMSYATTLVHNVFFWQAATTLTPTPLTLTSLTIHMTDGSTVQRDLNTGG